MINHCSVTGSTHNDEMCNLYVMFYLEQGNAKTDDCWNMEKRNLVDLLPEDSDKPMPPNPKLEGMAKGHHHHQQPQAAPKEERETKVSVLMPGATPREDDSYICTYKDMSEHGSLPMYINKIEVSASAAKVHHLIVQACPRPAGGGKMMW